MTNQNLTITKLEGYSGIRLLNKKPLTFKNGINLLVGRNGVGKTNLIQLINSMTPENPDIKEKIESSFFKTHAETALNKHGNNLVKKFGVINVVHFEFNGISGSISIGLKDGTEEYVLLNVMEPSGGYQNQLITYKSGPKMKLKFIHNGGSTLKLDFGGSLRSSVLSIQRDKDLSSIIEKPIGMINEFVHNKMTEFFHSEEFTKKIKDLEVLINEKLKKFFGSNDKSISLIQDSRHYLHVQPILMDGENEIKPEYISTGEGVLLNLIFTLASPDLGEHDILTFDEPEQHMHDDMIAVLADEIDHLTYIHPHCKIIIATHSTSLIEKLSSYGKEKVNLITFDEERNVSNSNKDIDLINALNRNGVWFSPLMLSKRNNIYIENQGNGKKSHKDFYLKFFDSNNRPNIIPIGSGASVEQSGSFTETLEDLIGSTDIKSKGIRDGDIWVKDSLVKYISGKISDDDFIELLPKEKTSYIQVKRKKSSKVDYFFNFWEIENLYLMPELIKCWVKKGKSLNLKEYKRLLKKYIAVLEKEYMELFLKRIYPRPNKSQILRNKVDKIRTAADEMEAFLHREEEITLRVNNLIQKLISINALHWLPGKEIYALLKNEGYDFNDSVIEYNTLEVSTKVREILVL